MRDQIRTMRLESQELEEHLSRQIADIRDINESNVRVKEIMEQQLIDHKDSIGKIYSITAGLEQHMPDEVIFYAVEMLEKLMQTKDVALYNVVNRDYARIFSASSDKARSLGNSIRYKEMTEIYDALTEQTGTVFHTEIQTYRYRTRGIVYDFAPTPYIPYPEVVSYIENQDGTITLEVNAVWPQKELDQAFCHSVTIRLLDKDRFQYVSNYVSRSEIEVTWYTERLSDEKWEECYGDN